MLQTIFIMLQILGIVAFAMGVWFNFHQRQSKSAGVESVRRFFHKAAIASGDIEILNAAMVVAAIISLVHADYRIFAAMMGFAVVVGALMMLNNKVGEVKDQVKSKFTTQAGV